MCADPFLSVEYEFGKEDGSCQAEKVCGTGSLPKELGEGNFIGRARAVLYVEHT